MPKNKRNKGVLKVFNIFVLLTMIINMSMLGVFFNTNDAQAIVVSCESDDDCDDNLICNDGICTPLLCIDSDFDGVCDDVDNCVNDSNQGQEDGDGDGIGDVCDNCPLVSNSDQVDTDSNGVGDACEIQECIPETEVCTDGIDNDCDQYIDCEDSDCLEDDACRQCEPEDEICSDGVDNDCDQLVDCDDPDCSNASECNIITPNCEKVYNPVCEEGALVEHDGPFATLNIGDADSETGFTLEGWSDSWDWGGAYGGGDDQTFRLLMGPGDGCGKGYEMASVSFNTGNNYLMNFDVRHLDGTVDDSFDVYVNDELVGHYDAGQYSGETWVTSTFDFLQVKGDVTVKFVATEPDNSWCADWGQVAFSWIEFNGFNCELPLCQEGGAVFYNEPFADINIGDPVSEADFTLEGWSDIWDWGGNYGGGDDQTFRLLMGPNDGCGEGYEDASISFNTGSSYLNSITVRHLDGQVDDSFDVYVNDALVDHYTGGQQAGEVWVTATFDFSPVKGDVTLKFVSTEPDNDWCQTWGQVTFSWIEFNGYYCETYCEEGMVTLLNPSFEIPAVTSSNGWQLYDYSEVGWFVDWVAPRNDAPDPALLELQNGVKASWIASDEDQYAELDSDYGFGSNEPASVAISQPVDTFIGALYELSFDFSPRPGIADNELVVEVAGIEQSYTADGSSNSATDWENKTIQFTAQSNSTLIEFYDGSSPDSFGTFLDNVILELVDCDPEPECTSDIEGKKFNYWNETGVEDWKIYLYDAAGALAASTTTDSDGEYKFEDICAGIYVVSEDSRFGWIQDYPVDPNAYTVEVSGDETVYEALDFVNKPMICGYKLDYYTGLGLEEWGISLYEENECAEGDEFADKVIDSNQGDQLNGDPVKAVRSVPEQGLELELGKDESNFFSLGFGGSIIVEFNNPVVNNNGTDADLKVTEDTWGGGYPLEAAKVYASKDMSGWVYLGNADNSNLNLIHTTSEFDLGALDWAKYVKIVDISDPEDFVGIPAADGYDLNAVEGLVCETNYELIEKKYTNEGGQYCFAVEPGDYRVEEDSKEGWTAMSALYYDINFDGTEPLFADDFINKNIKIEMDFGDTPDPAYPTLLVSDGARHVISPRVYLGAGIDSELDGQPSTAADGDDVSGVDDEDGVVIGLLKQGVATSVEVTASAPGYLNAWFDFSGDGDWDDAGEQVFTDQPLTAGLNNLTVNVPDKSIIGNTYARFRFDTSGGLNYTGLAKDGEVEDYIVEIFEDLGSLHGCKYQDLDNNGAIDEGESKLHGWLIKLYDCSQDYVIARSVEDKLVMPSCTFVKSATTDETGCYEFTGLKKNIHYKIVEDDVRLDGDWWSLTYPESGYWYIDDEPGDRSFDFANYVEPGCGNGIVEKDLGEECDDGNTDEDDGCNDSCKYEKDTDPYCGDGICEGVEGCHNCGQDCGSCSSGGGYYRYSNQGEKANGINITPIVKGEEGAPVLEINKSVNKPKVNPGQTGVRFTVVIKNSGNLTAYGVSLNELLGQWLSFSGDNDFTAALISTASAGDNSTGDDTSRTWDLGDINPGESKTVEYDVEVSANAESGSVGSVSIASADNHDDVEAMASVEIEKVIVLAETGFNLVEFLALFLTAFIGLFTAKRLKRA